MSMRTSITDAQIVALQTRILEFLEEHQMEAHALSDQCWLSPGVIGRYLRNGAKPSNDTIRKIARGMGTTPEDLLAPLPAPEDDGSTYAFADVDDDEPLELDLDEDALNGEEEYGDITITH